MIRIVVVTGGRDPQEFTALDVRGLLDAHVLQRGPIDELWHGAARGVDRWCAEWADRRGVAMRPFPVSDHEWQTIGSAAGPIRNGRMIAEAARAFDDGAEVTVLAFPGGSGTANCVRLAKRALLEVVSYSAYRGAFAITTQPSTRQRPVSEVPIDVA